MEHSRRKTLSAMRLISASPEGSIRVQLTHALYKVRWLALLGAGKTVSYRIVTNPTPSGLLV